MASNTEIIIRDLTNSPDFVEELLPAAERTALLYHLSYLCLGHFPNLERIIRKSVLENQLVFGSFEAFLLKCSTTSEDLVSSLLPMLKLAVEGNQMNLVENILGKAVAWITEIVDGAKRIIERCEQHNQNMASCISDVVQEKMETENNSKHQSTEIENLEMLESNFKETLKILTDNKGQIQENISEKNTVLCSLLNDVCKKSKDEGSLTIYSILIPIPQHIIDSTQCGGSEIKALMEELSQLSFEQSGLEHEEMTIQNKLIAVQFKMASLKIKEGAVPDNVHLEDVQRCLSRIHQILIQLQKFWETVRVLLESMKNRAQFGEDIIKYDISNTSKNSFLKAVDNAEENWKTFGQSCLNVKNIFNLQNKDAYKFLESNPPLGSVEWNQAYESVMQKLKNINPDP